MSSSTAPAILFFSPQTCKIIIVVFISAYFAFFYAQNHAGSNNRRIPHLQEPFCRPPAPSHQTHLSCSARWQHISAGCNSHLSQLHSPPNWVYGSTGPVYFLLLIVNLSSPPLPLHHFSSGHSFLLNLLWCKTHNTGHSGCPFSRGLISSTSSEISSALYSPRQALQAAKLLSAYNFTIAILHLVLSLLYFF